MVSRQGSSSLLDFFITDSFAESLVGIKNECREKRFFHCVNKKRVSDTNMNDFSERCGGKRVSTDTTSVLCWRRRAKWFSVFKSRWQGRSTPDTTGGVISSPKIAT